MVRKSPYRQPRAERRDKILDVATRVFSQRGYRLTDVQEIADILQVGKGTVYRHFKSKQRLFASVIERGMQRLLEEIHKKTQDAVNPLERLKLAIRTHIEFFGRNMDLVELFMQERSEFKEHFEPLYQKYYRHHMKRIEEIIKKCIKLRLVKPIDPKGVTSLLGDLYYGLLFTLSRGGQRRLREKGKYILDVFIGNILVK